MCAAGRERGRATNKVLGKIGRDAMKDGASANGVSAACCVPRAEFSGKIWEFHEDLLIL